MTNPYLEVDNLDQGIAYYFRYVTTLHTYTHTPLKPWCIY